MEKTIIFLAGRDKEFLTNWKEFFADISGDFEITDWEQYEEKGYDTVFFNHPMLIICGTSMMDENNLGMDRIFSELSSSDGNIIGFFPVEESIDPEIAMSFYLYAINPPAISLN